MRTQWRDVCVVFAASENFLPGAVVGIASFLKRHSRFGGEIVFFHDGLPAELRATLKGAFPPLRFERVDAALLRRLARLGEACPAMRGALPSFYALEAFRIEGFRKVLYCDSDLLFRRPIEDLFASAELLLCCGDEEHVNGWSHDADTFRRLKSPSDAGPGGALERTFNSGLMLIDGRLTGERAYAELLGMVTPDTWRRARTPHTDQFLLNRRFAGQQTLVSSTYNYPIHMAAAIRAREGLRAEQARVLHFTGRIKPWMPDRMLRVLSGDRRFRPDPLFGLWYEAWTDCLAGGHLRAAARPARRRAAAPMREPGHAQ